MALLVNTMINNTNQIYIVLMLVTLCETMLHVPTKIDSPLSWA
uniref:Uncharacterized protein n=1 Tax=Arundo donax TaxID=35708 RepID=A0A0A9BVN5_ARUDO